MGNPPRTRKRVRGIRRAPDGSAFENWYLNLLNAVLNLFSVFFLLLLLITSSFFSSFLYTLQQQLWGFGGNRFG
jgi:hypothetical protein